MRIIPRSPTSILWIQFLTIVQASNKPSCWPISRTGCTSNYRAWAIKLSIKNRFIFFTFFAVIIKSITIQTLYLNSMWMPPHTSLIAFLNQIVFIVLSALTAFNFVMAAVLGPSYLPIGWKPKNKKHESYLQLCAVCPGTFKAPRAHHCRKCGRCVAKMVNW